MTLQHRHEGLALIFKRAAAARWRALRGACGLVSIGMATLVLTTPGARANPSPTTLGIGIAVAPRYEGSSTFHLEPFPILSASRGIFFIDGLDGGIAIPLGGNLKTGLVLSTQFGRDQSDGDRLNGLGDIDTTAAFGPFLDWHPGAFDASLKFFQSLHSGYGATLTLDTKYKFQLSERDSVTVGNSATWASRSSQQTFFGVTPGQA